MNITINTSEITNTSWLSLRPFTCYFSKVELPNFIKQYCNKGFSPLNHYVNSLRSGEYIKKDNYSLLETNYVYLKVGNFSKYEIDLKEITYLNNEAGENFKDKKIEENDLVITRSGTVGNISQFKIPEELKEKIFIPSHHLAIIKTNNIEENIFLKHFMNYPFFKDYFNAFSTGKVQKEITNWSVKRIPIPYFNNKMALLKKLEKAENNINEISKSIFSLQHLIGKVLVKHKIKSDIYFDYRTSSFNTSILNVSKNKSVRIGAEYNDFWKNHNGNLFDDFNKKMDLLPLKRILTFCKPKKLKKGELKETRILIDFGQINELLGTIILSNEVVEIGSDKVDLSESDLVTNKLDPYSGYTFINDSNLKLIGSSELWPLKIKNPMDVNKNYIRYLLLSYEYLSKSKLLMSGKRHPRIHSLDFLNIRVPLPSKNLQEKIVAEIQKLELQSEKARNKIRKIRGDINKMFYNELEKLKN